MIAKAYSAISWGIQAFHIDVEVDISNGLPQFNVVGLPDLSVREAKDRVRAAITNSGYSFPTNKITINLAPADIKKEGATFDLPIALGILAAHDIIPKEILSKFVFLGELALDGSLRPIKGALVIANTFPEKTIILPAKNSQEACLEQKATVYAAENLKQVVNFLKGESNLSPLLPKKDFKSLHPSSKIIDFADVKGQYVAKRALEIAVAGGHNLLLIGSPGSGKTMLARCIPGILPPLSFDEALEITKIHSVAGTLNEQGFVHERPFRAPHYSASPTALIGGGTWPKPGEVSLSHHGVLFLDELPEFRRDVIESLRTPLEDNQILISRAKQRALYPCAITLAAAMNPCPCGFLGDPKKPCRCSLNHIQKYRNKISGPILDRIDFHIEVPNVSYEDLESNTQEESSADVQQRILKCREIQKNRYQSLKYKLNSRLQAQEIKKHATPSKEGQRLLKKAMKELHFSARSFYKVLKISRTIADLKEEETITEAMIAEALQYRNLDRQWS